MVLVITMIFVSASNFTGELEEECEVVETCEDVLVGVSCVNKTIESCEDVCSIEIISECHEESSEVCELVVEEVCEDVESCSEECETDEEGNEQCNDVCDVEKICEDATNEVCNEVTSEVCEDVEKKICEHINCFEEVIENCGGVIEQKECVIETICNVPNNENLTDSQTFPSDEGSSVESANESLSSEKVVGEVQNGSVENFTEVNDGLNLNESLELINNMTFNISITNMSEANASEHIQNLTILNEIRIIYFFNT